MKLKKILIFLIVLTVLINVSCIYAADNNTDGLGENNEINIYVNANTGDDSYTGDSWETPVKSIGKAIDLIDNNKTTNIYLGNGTYIGENNAELNIENKNIINIIGSDNSIISGENLKPILTLSNISKITIKNVQYINATNKNLNYGVALTINNANVLIDNCQFRDNTKSSIYNSGNLTITNTYFSNNKDRVNDNWNSIVGGAIYNTGNLNIDNTTFKENYAGSGGAIYNTGNLNVNNSTFRYNKGTNHGSSMITDSIKYRSDGSRGGDICNFGNAIITNSTFKETQLIDLGYHGGSIYNNGTMLLDNVEISNIEFTSDDPVGRHSLGTAIANIGNLTLKDSVIANITSHLAYQGRIQGAIQNEGMFTATGCIFENNKADTVYQHQLYYDIGTGNIYNTGEGILNITSCAFFNKNPKILPTVAQDVAIIAGSAICLENNTWSGEDPLTNYHIYGTLNVTKYWLLSLEPDYYMLEIGEKANITQTLKLMYEKYAVDYTRLPDLYVKFNVNGQNITKKITDGRASVEFNQSDVKGSYVVTSTVYNIVNTAEVDVGKEYSAMQVESEEIDYGDDAKFYMTVTGNYTHKPTGNITVTIDGKKYTTKIDDTKASMSISGLLPKTYDLIIRYEGDEDYFKSIFHHNYTVHKKPTYMNITIPEINYGETGTITVSLSPEKVSSQAYMYITDETNKTTKKTVFVKNCTEIKLKNYAAGEYSITIELWDNKYYLPSNASAIFKVNKFKTNLTITASDIDAGETEVLNITLSPKGEVAGEAILQINNYTQIIFLKNGENSVEIENMSGGTYDIIVTFPGDKKYAPSNATCTFTVKKYQTNITAKIENNILYINTTPNSTGKVQIFINDDVYEVNLTNSQATLPVSFTKAENYIFIYYLGDGYYNYTTCNLTYEYDELLNLTGYDETFYNTENATYYVTLTDEKGYGIANKTITLKINNDIFEYVTESDGSVTVPLNPTVGKYQITAQYRNRTSKNTVTILEDAFITGNDTQAYTNMDFTYQIELKDHNGKAIKNVELTFAVNGKTYTNKTDVNGQATITLNLKAGTYTITTTYKNTTNANELEIIEKPLLIGQNIKAYENTDFIYTITLTRTDGTPIMDKEITFIINNRRYTDTTNSEGKASKTLNLPQGNYTITAIYKNTRITNNLTIIEDYNLNGNNIRANSERDFTYSVNLTDHNGKTIKNAEITFEINGQTYKNKTNSNGQAAITLNLKEGNYTITSTYKDIKISNKIEIIETYQITGINVKSYENFDFEYIVTLKNHNSKTLENAEITFEINGETYKNKTDVNGKSKLTLNLKKGNYTITASYKDIKTTNKLEIIEYDLERIISSEVEMYYHDGTRFKIQLLNQTTPLANKTVTITINGVPYTRTTNENGTTSVPLNLNAGTYTVTTRYNNLEKNNTVTVKSTIEGNDITKVFRNGTQYYATFYTSKGEILKNTPVTFNINGVFYTRTTNENGTAKMNINLEQGTYIITATNPETGEQHSNTVTVIPKIIENNDLTKYFRNSSQYRVKIIDSQGNPAKAGQTVTFNINGVFYTRNTNSEGYAQLNINIQPGTYTITAEYDGCRISNQITVKPILEAQNIKMKYRDGTQFKATLLNGQGTPYANQQLTFNINGVFYTRTTNENGTAKLNINLQPGEYIITTSYNEANTANTIKIE